MSLYCQICECFWDSSPHCCPRKVARIGKVVWCRILVTGILELISDFPKIERKRKISCSKVVNGTKKSILWLIQSFKHSQVAQVVKAPTQVVIASIQKWANPNTNTYWCYVATTLFLSGHLEHSGRAHCLMDWKGWEYSRRALKRKSLKSSLKVD